jgi:hypothetical protein
MFLYLFILVVAVAPLLDGSITMESLHLALGPGAMSGKRQGQANACYDDTGAVSTDGEADSRLVFDLAIGLQLPTSATVGVSVDTVTLSRVYPPEAATGFADTVAPMGSVHIPDFTLVADDDGVAPVDLRALELSIDNVVEFGQFVSDFLAAKVGDAPIELELAATVSLTFMGATASPHYVQRIPMFKKRQPETEENATGPFVLTGIRIAESDTEGADTHVASGGLVETPTADDPSALLITLDLDINGTSPMFSATLPPLRFNLLSATGSPVGRVSSQSFWYHPGWSSTAVALAIVSDEEFSSASTSFGAFMDGDNITMAVRGAPVASRSADCTMERILAHASMDLTLAGQATANASGAQESTFSVAAVHVGRDDDSPNILPVNVSLGVSKDLKVRGTLPDIHAALFVPPGPNLAPEEAILIVARGISLDADESLDGEREPVLLTLNMTSAYRCGRVVQALLDGTPGTAQVRAMNTSPLSRIVSSYTFALDYNDATAASSLADEGDVTEYSIEALEITDGSRAIAARVTAAFAAGIQNMSIGATDLPQISLEFADGAASLLLLDVSASVELPGEGAVAVTATLIRAAQTAELFERAVDGERPHVTVRGAPDDSSFLGSILQYVEYSVALGSADTEEESADGADSTVRLESLHFAGARDSGDDVQDAIFLLRLRVGVDPTGEMPSAFAPRVSTVPTAVLPVIDVVATHEGAPSGSESLAQVTILGLGGIEGVYDVGFAVSAPSRSAFGRLLDVAFGGGAVGFRVSGEDPSSALSRLLRARPLELDLDTGGADAHKVEGGVMPRIDISHRGSSRDQLRVDLAFTVEDLPLPFNVSLGTAALHVFGGPGKQELLVAASHLGVGPGTTDFAFSVDIDVLNSARRAALQSVVSRYLLPTDDRPLPLEVALEIEGEASSNSAVADAVISLGIPLSALEPLVLKYDFELPQSPGGDDSNPIKCTESKELNVLSWNLISGNCAIDVLLDVYMANPTPLTLSVHTFTTTVVFDDFEGVPVFFPDPSRQVELGVITEDFSSKPIVLPPDGTPVPIPIFLEGSSGGGWNEVCARAGNLYQFENDLRLDLRNAVAGLFVENFYLELCVDVFDIFVDKDEPDSNCAVSLGLV